MTILIFAIRNSALIMSYAPTSKCQGLIWELNMCLSNLIF